MPRHLQRLDNAMCAHGTLSTCICLLLFLSFRRESTKRHSEAGSCFETPGILECYLPSGVSSPGPTAQWRLFSSSVLLLKGSLLPSRLFTLSLSLFLSLSLCLCLSVSLSLAPPVTLCLIHDARKTEFIHLLIHSFTRFVRVYLSLSLPVCVCLSVCLFVTIYLNHYPRKIKFIHSLSLFLPLS